MTEMLRYTGPTPTHGWPCSVCRSMAGRWRTVRIWMPTVMLLIVVCSALFVYAKYLNTRKTVDYHETFSHWETSTEWTQRISGTTKTLVMWGNVM